MAGGRDFEVDSLWRDTSSRERFRVTFDEDPDAYERTRPVCPRQVFDDLVTLAGLNHGDHVVEIGPGTGQATRPLAERGLTLMAIEIGRGMAERARSNLGAFANVSVINAAFEDWDPAGQSFDAVFSCNAFHWIDPAARLAKPAAILRPGGSLCIIATPWVVPDDADPFWWEVQDDYVAVGGERVDPASMHPDRVADLGPFLAETDLFQPPTLRRYRFDVEFSTEEYLLNLSTQSGIKVFNNEQRSELFKRIGGRIDGRGGRIRAHLVALLTVRKVRAAT